MYCSSEFCVCLNFPWDVKFENIAKQLDVRLLKIDRNKSAIIYCITKNTNDFFTIVIIIIAILWVCICLYNSLRSICHTYQNVYEVNDSDCVWYRTLKIGCDSWMKGIRGKWPSRYEISLKYLYRWAISLCVCNECRCLRYQSVKSASVDRMNEVEGLV